MLTFLFGFGIGLSFILAIGAQNAFVLKQGLKKQHVFAVCFICALSDSLLIALGVGGFSSMVAQHPAIVDVAKYAGAAFLFAYGLKSFHAATKHTSTLVPNTQAKTSLLSVIGICLAFTWLNPHVYLDTVFLIGAISTQHSNRHIFALGAMSASWLFFFALGYGARLLLPVFSNPKAWQVLELIIGVVMWAIALSLILN